MFNLNKWMAKCLNYKKNVFRQFTYERPSFTKKYQVFKGVNSDRKSLIRKISFLTTYQDENSQRYRVYNPIEELTEAGIECIVFKEDGTEDMECILDSDLLVVFRVASSDNVMRILKEFNRRHIPVVFDIDDLIFEPESADLLYAVAIMDETEKSKRIEDMCRVRETLLASDYVTCSTEALSKRVERLNKKSYVFPNTINTSQYNLAEILRKEKKPQLDNRVKLGYLSGTRTHEKDFQEASDALYEVMKRNGEAELYVVGILDLDNKFLGFGDRVVRAPLMGHLEMLRYLSRMDINLAPLEINNAFTDCKSELKIFEAALVGVPTVASPTDSYKRCIDDGVNGFLAATKEEWVNKIEYLIHDKRLRDEMAGRANSDFVKGFFIKNIIGDLIRIYENIALDYRKT
ncbi:MAG: glycosyltransferase family 4 protein [Deltaproteobacteria bacterium]|nr:glycosyltransferase family 4 protein [Deltaproteobacteria bacterium]